MTAQRLLVVTGARVLNDTRASKLWALRILAEHLFAGDVDVVVHGACVASPDEWSDDLAHLARIDRIVWSVGGPHRYPRVCAGGAWRDLRDVSRYPYNGPLERNAAMVRWAADQRDAGHAVRVLGLRAPWATTHGTEHTLTQARKARLDVQEYVCPVELGPKGER